MKKILLLFLFVTFQYSFSQNIQFLNKDKQPLEGVLLIDNTGKYVGTTDEEGKIPDENIKNSDYIIANHRTVQQDTIYTKDIKNGVVFLNSIREKLIPEVVVKNTDKEYICISGYFNGYTINNNEFNAYIDGIVEYVIDKKTNKIKDKIIKEYRSFILESNNENRKVVSSVVFDRELKVPEMKRLKDIVDNTSNYTKLENTPQKEMTYVAEKNLLENKEFKLFGYVFTDFFMKGTYTFSGDKTTPKNLVQHSFYTRMKAKHKTENDFAVLQFTNNFYPNEVSFKNKNELEKGVKFDKNKSQYSTKYWENDENAAVYKILSSKFKENFKLQ